jgi:hypothetical protein
MTDYEARFAELVLPSAGFLDNMIAEENLFYKILACV